MPSSPRPRTSATRLAIGKAILLIGVSFATLALVHLNLSMDFRHRDLRPSELEEQKKLYQELQQQQQERQQQHQYQPPPLSPPSQQQHSGQNNTAAPLTPHPHPTSDSGATFIILAETDLTRTVQYPDGVQHKIFKDQFFKHPEAAKREMGSFLDRLATRSWWNVVPTGPQSEDEEEGDDREDHTSLTAKAPGRFFTYLPLGGSNNQFTALQKSALLAKDLGRTLLLPPISPNQHVKTWAGPAYSEFFNLDQFTRLSGIYVLEWHAIKQTPSSDPPKTLTRHWEDFSEELVCIPNGGVGLSNQSLFDRFRPQFLLKYRPYIPREDTTHGKSTDYAYAKDVLLRDEVDVGASGTSPSPELLKCLSCPYFLGGADLGKRLWGEVGVHLRFNTRIEAMVDDILDMLLGPTTKGAGEQSVSRKPFRPHPEFIIVHLRRGDIVKKCPAGVAEQDCIVQIETIAEKVDEIEKKRRIKALEGTEKDTVKHLPVLVTTNEKRVEELDKIEKLGWILLDHGDKSEDEDKEGGSTNMRKLGTFAKYGPWYPPMLDAVLLTRGNYMIGMKSSRMSALAGQRGHAWYGHETMLL